LADVAAILDESSTNNTLVGRISEGIRQLGVVRVVGIGTALTAALSIFVYAAISFTAPEYSVLYTGLNAEDSGAIIKKLEAQNEPYTLRDDGTTILVDKAHIPRIRIAVAEEKIISGGTVGYELLDRADPLSTTNSQFQVNRTRALEGELARTIGAINGVVSARVHLDVPTRDLFAEGESSARASVVLKLQGDRRLQPRSVEAIQQVVASAVKNLAPEHVAIVDAQGNLLARGDGNEQSAASTALFERKADYERRYRDSVERLLEQYIGPNRVRADVTVDLDLAQVKRTSETFDPKSRVERSIQTVDEGSNRNDSRAPKDVSVRQNLPEGQQAPSNGQASQEANNRT
jgi:flagellar M-ring protein FliF